RRGRDHRAGRPDSRARRGTERSAGRGPDRVGRRRAGGVGRRGDRRQGRAPGARGGRRVRGTGRPRLQGGRVAPLWGGGQRGGRLGGSPTRQARGRAGRRDVSTDKVDASPRQAGGGGRTGAAVPTLNAANVLTVLRLILVPVFAVALFAADPGDITDVTGI